MSKSLGKWLLGLCASFAPFACLATLPRTDLCYDVLCLSIVEGSRVVKDRTYQQDSTGRRFLMMRFTEGEYLSVLVRPVSGSVCPETSKRAVAMSRSRTDLVGRGCLAVPEADRFFQVDFTLSSPKIPVQSKLHSLDPQVRISGITDIKHWSGPTYDSNTLLFQPRDGEP